MGRESDSDSTALTGDPGPPWWRDAGGGRSQGSRSRQTEGGEVGVSHLAWDTLAAKAKQQ